MRGHLIKPVAGVLCLFSVAFTAGIRAHALEAGAAKVDLALEPGIPLDGDFTRRGRGATSVHDPLYVRALYLEQDGTACFIVTADLFAITPDLRARILELAPTAVDAGNIILVATHTRSGPGGLDRSWLARQRSGRFMPELVDAIAMKFSEAMKTAYESRVRGAIGYASGAISLGVDRFSPTEPTEPRVTVLRVDDSDGNPIAIAANFGAAADIASRVDPFVLSADYPGAFCDSLEEMTAGGMVAMFLNADSGDRLAIRSDASPGWQDVRQVGGALAARTKALANEITCRLLPVRVSASTESVPQNVAPSLLPASATTHALEIDRLAVTFSPVVPYSATTARMRSAALGAGYTYVMTVAPANGYLGAAPPADRYALVDDSADPVYVDPGAADTFADRAVHLLSRVTPEPAQTEAEPAPASRVPEVFEGIARYTEVGAPERLGRARGESLRTVLPNGLDPAVSFDWLGGAPTSEVLGHWRLLRGPVNDEPLLVALASNEARRLLGSLSEDSGAKLRGMAEACGVGMQPLWLAQFAPAGVADGKRVSPVNLLFSGTAPEDGLLIAQTIQWPVDVTIAVTQASPRGGHAYVSVGLPWQLTGACGVNERGVALAVVPEAFAADQPLHAPAEVLFDDILARANTFDDALALLTEPRAGISGRVLLGVDDRDATQAALVEVGPHPQVYDGAAGVVPRDAVRRRSEARVARLLSGLHEPGADDLERIVTDRDRQALPTDFILSPETRSCIVLVPRLREVRVMAPDRGEPRAFQRIRVGGEGL